MIETAGSGKIHERLEVPSEAMDEKMRARVFEGTSGHFLTIVNRVTLSHDNHNIVGRGIETGNIVVYNGCVAWNMKSSPAAPHGLLVAGRRRYIILSGV